jgi:hypothetical protein
MRIKLFLPFILLAAMFAGCSCEKRMQRLMYRCPQLFERKTVPAVVVVPESVSDTVFVFSPGEADTLRIVDERIETLIVRRFDTLKVSVRVPADTVIEYISVEVPKPEIIVKERVGIAEGVKRVFLWGLAASGMLCAFGVVLLLIIKQIKNRSHGK